LDIPELFNGSENPDVQFLIIFLDFFVHSKIKEKDQHFNRKKTRENHLNGGQGNA